MFFLIAKLFWALAQPFNFLLILGFVGVILSFSSWRRWGHRVCVISLSLFVLLSLTPIGSFVLRPIEDRFPLPPSTLAPPTGIIVLGGGLDEDLTAARHEPTEVGERVTMGAILARRFPKARLIFTGGSPSLHPSGEDEATGVKEIWTELGVDPARMTFEKRSRNTWENGLFARPLVKPQPGDKFLLVTAAWHMPRAMGVFRKLGYDVIAYPTDYMTLGDSRDYGWFKLGPGQLGMFDAGLHEWIGLAVYHFTGKSSAWFPAP